MPDINSDYISQKLKAHTPAPEGVFRHSAVLIPIFETERGYELLFCKRSMTLRRQPGDVCFPGGGRDGDETNLETALRETWEETGIPAENIEILGQTDYVITSYGAVITPFVGLIKNTSPDRLRINPDEVEETFLVPLSFFLNREPETHYVYINIEVPDDFPFEHIVGGRNYGWSKGRQPELFYFYRHQVIWGFTARVVKNLCSILKQ
ncbi:MAG TPA: CoA pyrophosphatase [Firmicutes bacterium]|nr:CoA pyrophosphatase [Bacillota bacterium]